MVNQKGQVMQYYGATPYITIDSTFLEPKWYGSYCVGHKGWTQPMQSSTHTHTKPPPPPHTGKPSYVNNQLCSGANSCTQMQHQSEPWDLNPPPSQCNMKGQSADIYNAGQLQHPRQRVSETPCNPPSQRLCSLSASAHFTPPRL